MSEGEKGEGRYQHKPQGEKVKYIKIKQDYLKSKERGALPGGKPPKIDLATNQGDPYYTGEGDLELIQVQIEKRAKVKGKGSASF